MGTVRVLLIGDVVGEPGIAALEAELSRLVADSVADFVIVNGENAAAGFGLTDESLNRLFAAGADVVTSGNHIWEKRDIWPFLDAEERQIALEEKYFAELRRTIAQDGERLRALASALVSGSATQSTDISTCRRIVKYLQRIEWDFAATTVVRRFTAEAQT